MLDFFKRMLRGNKAPELAPDWPLGFAIPPSKPARDEDVMPPVTVASTPVPPPSSVWWNALSSDRIASIQVVFDADRSQPGTLVMLDASGRLVSGPWAAIGKADSVMAADQGNPGCDPFLRFGDTPTGDYHVMDVLPARTDEVGIAMFGANPVLRLRPLSGDAAMADSNGRTSLLIHGGREATAPTDGSIRVPDEAMLSLISRLPANPSTLRPRIVVSVQQTADERPQAWRTRPSSLASSDARAWRSSGTYSSTSVRTGYWQSQPYYDDDVWWWFYYQQMYDFEIARSAPYQDYVPGAVLPDTMTVDPGQVDTTGVQGTYDPAPAPDAYVPADNSASPAPDNTDMHSRSQSPLEQIQAISSGDTWSPAGGAYGR